MRIGISAENSSQINRTDSKAKILVSCLVATKTRPFARFYIKFDDYVSFVDQSELVSVNETVRTVLEKPIGKKGDQIEPSARGKNRYDYTRGHCSIAHWSVCQSGVASVLREKARHRTNCERFDIFLFLFSPWRDISTWTLARDNYARQINFSRPQVARRPWFHREALIEPSIIKPGVYFGLTSPLPSFPDNWQGPRRSRS